MNSNAGDAGRKLARDGTRRGGSRPGAGRKKQELRSPTAINSVDLAAALALPPPSEIEAALAGRASRSIDGLVKIMLHGSSDPARISAAEEILDRGYGKPGVEIGGDSAAPLLPFFPPPPSSALAASTADIREQARRYAILAITVLCKIAENSLSEQARVAAEKALVKRERGTVGVAKILDEQRNRPVGKKEEASRAAAAAATGRYATPASPSSRPQ